VTHEEYGVGQVIDLSGDGSRRRLRVRFAKAGEKVFVAGKARLTLVQ
jgi:hypothetical protein